MARKTHRDRQDKRLFDTWSTETLVRLSAVIGVVVVGLETVLVFKLLAALTGTTVPSWNPFDIVFRSLLGRGGFPGWWWLIAFILAAATATAWFIGLYWWHRRQSRKERERVDKAARLTGASYETAPITRDVVQAKSERLGVSGFIGLPIGTTVFGGEMRYSSAEDVAVIIAGSRMGKTSGWVVPRILAAPGAVVVTSNKRDVVDLTRYVTSRFGQRVWVFDPQNLIGEEQSWWWNPLRKINTPADATYFTQVIADATRKTGAKTDAFFDNAGQELAAGMVLAAACKNGTLRDVYSWLTAETDSEPARILYEHGWKLSAEAVDGALSLADRTRSGVYAVARGLFEFVKDDRAMAWVTPPEDGSTIPEFKSEEFAKSFDRLYVVSQEGRGSATAIVTALTVEVAMTALDTASLMPGGRLKLPMLLELDEAANVCPWRDLPAFYSHFGSRGICVDTVLQSWSQGKERWGEFGMRAMWEAATICAYGGGSKEQGFLSEFSQLVGDHYLDQITVTRSRSTSSTAVVKDGVKEPIATVADLAALPMNRLWVKASGSVPAIVEMQFFYNGVHAEAIKRSEQRSRRALEGKAA